MKILLFLTSLMLLVSCESRPNSETMTNDDKISYALGFIAGKQIKTTMGSDLVPDMLLAGLKDSLDSKETMVQEDEAYALLNSKQAATTNKVKEANLKQQEDFLSTLKDKPGILKTPEGVYYEYIGEKKAGKAPKLSDVIRVNYSGYFIDGKVFDSSEGQAPVEFRLSDVIKGWGDVLQLVPVGNSIKVYIPSELAYGERGVPGFIEPNQMLIFEINLLEIVNPSKK